MKFPSVYSKLPNIKNSPEPFCYNTGTLLDIATGAAVKSYDGKHWLVNGGLPGCIGVSAFPNVGKSSVAAVIQSNVMGRYPGSSDADYDSEDQSNNRQRWLSSCTLHRDNPEKRNELFEELDSRHRVINKKDAPMTDDFLKTLLEEIAPEHAKLAKQYKLRTPFPDSTPGEPQFTTFPLFVEIDSISQCTFASEEKLENEVKTFSDQKGNLSWSRSSLSKTKLLDNIAAYGAKYNMRFILTAQAKKAFDMGGMAKYSPEKSPMPYGISLHQAGAGFLRLTNCLLYIADSTDLRMKDGDKTSRYGEKGQTADTEYSICTISIRRNKRQGTGEKFPMVFSKTNGYEHDLSNVEFLRVHSFGLTGNPSAWFECALLPGIKLNRFIVRDKAYENAQLSRGLELLANIRYIQLHMTRDASWDFRTDFTTEEIIEIVEKKGLKDRILNSRGWWAYDVEIDGKWVSTCPDQEYLSVFDVLKLLSN